MPHDQKEAKLMVQKLNTITELLQYLVALELSKNGVTHAQIGKHLHVAKATVGKMLRGIEEKK
jgi:DNA-binding MarR family transcriptional regulator